jgi:transcriptional regulator with XRE-family HTH domain
VSALADCHPWHSGYRRDVAKRRQSAEPPAVDPTLTDELARPVAGASIGERIARARDRKGWTKADLARETGKGWRAVHKWETGEVQPDRESIRLLAQVLAVTIEELLGVAVGQDPPFAAWKEFLATSEGASMNDGERRMMQALPWPPGREPTLAGYLMMLAAVRGGSRERTPN